jgi:hypothetical protein
VPATKLPLWPFPRERQPGFLRPTVFWPYLCRSCTGRLSHKVLPAMEMHQFMTRRTGFVIFFTNYGICIYLTTYVNYPCARLTNQPARRTAHKSPPKTRKINALGADCLAERQHELMAR